MRIVSGDNQTGVVGTPLATPIVVEVKDSSGRAVPGVWVLGWSYHTDGGGIVGDSVRTSADGRASVTWRVGSTVGTIDVNLTTSAAVQPGAGASATVNTVAGPVHHFWISSLCTQTGLVNAKFAGGSFTRNCLFLPIDAYDNVTDWPATAKVTVTNGWQISGDTIRPPAGAITSSAVVTVTAGSVTASNPVYLLEDLSKYNWHVSWTCAGPTAPVSDTTRVDTLQFDLYSTKWVYAVQPGYYHPQKAATTDIAQLFFTSGTMRTVRGTQVTVSNLTGSSNWGNQPTGIFRQRPDTLIPALYPAAAVPSDTIAVRVPQSMPPKFVGGTWCDPAKYTIRTPIIFEAY
jgi:hypothetical protein